MAYRFEKHAQTLELPLILQRLADEASIEDVKEQILSLTPSFNINEVGYLLNQTKEAYTLVMRFSAPSFGKAKNYNSAVSRAELGATLSTKELLGIAENLRIIRSVKAWRSNCQSINELSIDCFFSALSPNKFLEDKIHLAIKSEDEISDNASPALADIRRKISNNSAKIREDLEKIVKGKTAKYLQDFIITQRDGRFVVPVRAEYKGEIKGIVHDTSATGSTLFIEPMTVVETNNEIRVLKAQEQDEIARILAELSALVVDFAESIKTSYNALCELNLVFAKANLAVKQGAIVPKINNNGYVNLKRARHPLISNKTVVPITVSLGGDYDQLIITGPNTGGKTVSLKTVGLLSLMTMCGLMIPADDNSEIAVFSKIFADIGDEQSIEQSLSTFSSHMVNIISILSDCDENSLVLFDELCAGTDPVEGAALARSILMQIKNVGAKSIATTHYPELKSYALDTDRVENAGCEFDVETLKPTYRLIIGVPGRSNAFAISKRLGLSEDIIEGAKSELSDEDTRFERVVASLEKARQEAEKERSEASRIKSELAESKRKAEQLEHELKIKREKLMEQTREKASHIIEDARYRSSQLLNELEELKKNLNAENSSKSLEKARADYKRSLREMEDAADPVVTTTQQGEKLSRIPQKGDIVVLSSFGRDATVIQTDVSGKRCQVMSGSMKMWVGFDELRIKKGSQSTEVKKTRKVSGVSSKMEKIVSGEIDLRGMSSDEAIMELDKYIDNAVLSGITTVTIIHGKGTGVLRAAVHSYLRSHKNIATFRVGLFGEGENGVTIAQIK